MLDAFKDKVDSSPVARIDTDLLMDIKKRFMVCGNVIDVEGYDVECKTRYIADKFGHINGNLTPSSYRMVSEMYEDFCGSGGLFDYCVNKVEEFDAEMCSNVDNSGIEDDVDTLQDKVVTTASALDAMQVKVENMSKFSLGLISLSANKGLTEKEKKEMRNRATCETSGPPSRGRGRARASPSCRRRAPAGCRRRARRRSSTLPLSPL